jgi:predicted anti-sigma-YlaC factor YlaD
MKLTIDEALRMLAMRTEADAPPPPSHRVIWLRAKYARKQRLTARRRLLETLVLAAAAVLGVPGLLIWKGSWLWDDALPQLGEVAASGMDALGGTPTGVFIGLVLVALVLLEDVVVLD